MNSRNRLIWKFRGCCSLNPNGKLLEKRAIFFGYKNLIPNHISENCVGEKRRHLISLF
jgi:hypothetical protein